MNEIIERFTLELFDHHTVDYRQFIKDGTEINMTAMMNHPVLLSNVKFGFVWNKILGTYPTKMDFHEFLSANQTCDVTGICRFLGLYIQIIPVDTNALAQEFVKTAFNTPAYIRNYVLHKWHYRFDNFPHPDTIDASPLIYVFTRHVVNTKCSLTLPYLMPSRNMDPHATFPCKPSSDREAKQYLCHKDLHFIRNIASRGVTDICIDMDENPVVLTINTNWDCYPKVAKFSIGNINLGGMHIPKLPELPDFIPDFNKLYVTSLLKKSRDLIFLDFVAKYLLKKQKQCAKLASAPKLKDNVCIILDNRKNPMTIASLYMAACNLNLNLWDIFVFTSTASESYYTDRVGKFCNVVAYAPLDVKFNIDVYNGILMSASFWKNLGGYKKALIIQDDGVLLRPGIESFLEWDYVGAPWLDCNENAYIKQNVNAELVGNGGFSLRSVKAMIDVCENHVDSKNHLFYHNLVRVPEDVYFVKAMCGKYRIAPLEVAKKFSTEQVMCYESIGLHKAWAYNTPESVIEYFERVLSETS